jgi:fibronectin type 3 domain-containing protein
VESADSNEACVTLEDTQAPAAPTGFVAFVRENTIELFWDASPEADLAEYRIYRFPPETEPKLLLEVDAGVTRHVDTTATPGAVYFYHVRAVDKAGNESPPSGQAQGGIQ